MAARHGFFALLSALTAAVTGFLNYAIRAAPGDSPVWLSNWATGKRPMFALVALFLSILAAMSESGRWYIDKRNPSRDVLQKVIDDFARSLFRGRERKNRITLFKATSGWRAFLYGLLILPLFSKGHKWLALSRIRPRQTYLRVYVRPAEVRNRRSSTAFRVSDDRAECEGMAGLVWDEGYCILPDLPRIDKDELRGVNALEDLPNNHPIRTYANATNVTDLRLLKSVDNFGWHFLGSVIRRSDGTAWGVLLLDSDEDTCPFPADGGSTRQRFDDAARLIGKIVA